MKQRKKDNIIIFLIIGLLLGIFVKLFVLDILTISGQSMVPSIQDKNTVLVNKLAYGIAVPFSSRFFVQWSTPKKNDIVIFLHDNKIVVKRCVLLPNEQLEFLLDSGYNLILGGNKIPLTKEQYINLSKYEQVPDGFVFVLGDNYNSSIDSRDYGFVSTKNITGKIIGIN